MQNSKSLIFIVIVLAGCLGGVGSDIYAPSLPFIAVDLETSINNVQWTMAVFLFGISISQVFYGPISEGVGRRKPLMFGLSLALIGTIICLFSPHIAMLLVGRFVQGFGVGAGA